MNKLVFDSSPASESGQIMRKNDQRNSSTTNSINLDSSPSSDSGQVKGKTTEGTQLPWIT